MTYTPVRSGKMKANLIVLLCVIVTSKANAGSVDDCNLSPITNCPLYTFKSDVVAPQQMQDQNMMGNRWLMIYYSQFDAHQSYGKCNFRWNRPDSDGIIHKELMCYNMDMKGCENFERRLKREEDSCGRVEEHAVNSTMDAEFYSQDLTQYFWYDSCYNYTQSGQCEVRYLDLLVRDTRYPDSDDQKQELDLQGLPWHLISADLKNNFDMDISDIQMKFSWKGPECGFDGKIITTNSALKRETSYFALSFVVAFTFFF